MVSQIRTGHVCNFHVARDSVGHSLRHHWVTRKTPGPTTHHDRRFIDILPKMGPYEDFKNVSRIDRPNLISNRNAYMYSLRKYRS